MTTDQRPPTNDRWSRWGTRRRGGWRSWRDRRCGRAPPGRYASTEGRAPGQGRRRRWAGGR
eukprot:7420713-Alexandrium_andersonii.AAC.1